MPRRLVLAGCGGMGRRHLRGYRVLQDFEPCRLELAAVVDPEPARGSFVAKEAEDLLGLRPTVYQSLEDAVAGTPELEVIDVVAAAAAHLPLVEIATSAVRKADGSNGSCVSCDAGRRRAKRSIVVDC